VHEQKKETDTGLMALNDGILIAQNELSSTEHDVFSIRRGTVQALANEMENRSAFDPD